MDKFVSSPSGVKISLSFRDNLIIDRYHPSFMRMRSSKLKHMQSENSEDVLTWNVFHSLRQIDPQVWIENLFKTAFPQSFETEFKPSTVVELWKVTHPPLSLLESGDEGDSEIDICIQSPDWVWFIEAKLKSDISMKTSTRADRNQILRNIDVGTYYAGVRRFYFSLLTLNQNSSISGAGIIESYRDLSEPIKKLKHHRPDGLLNLKGVSHITWGDMANILQHCAEKATDDEKTYATRALQWMIDKKIGI